MTHPLVNATPADIAADDLMAARDAEKWADDYVITHARLDEFTSVPQPLPSTPYFEAQKMCLARLEAVENIKSVLLERYDIALRSEHGSGYSIVLAVDQVEWAQDVRRKRIQKALAKSLLRVFHVDTDLLTVEQNRERTDELAQISRLQSLHRKGKII